MKKYILMMIVIISFFSSCMKDKGNYHYKTLAEFKIEGIPAEVEVLSYIDKIKLSPKITSSLDGEIKPDNPNYSFRYRLGYKGMGMMVVNGERMRWADISPKTGFNLDVQANYEPDTYICWFTITDKRDQVVTSFLFDVKVSSPTYEGWMVLCNEGPQERVRLDMISVMTSTKTEALHDIANGLPAIHRATQLGFHPMKSTGGDIISILSKERSFRLDNSSLGSSEALEFNKNKFGKTMAETMVAFASLSVPGDLSYATKYSFVVSNTGNVYAHDHLIGDFYGQAINTPVAGQTPLYKVAPFVGISQVRPSTSSSALFYDIDNKRFVGFKGDASASTLFVLADPETKLFSFQTGQNMVYMEGTKRSNGLVYAILQDGTGSRSIYGINLAGSGFIQEAYYKNINAPGFNQASHFAFHSQFPILFYAVGNKVYLYNLGTQTAQEMTTLGLKPSEEVTLLKFNPFKNPLMTNLNKQTDEFMNQQFQLIVGTNDQAATDVNSGKVGFYKVDGQSNTISKVAAYDGFAKVVDVVYRER